MENQPQKWQDFTLEQLPKWLKMGGFIGLPTGELLLGWGNWQRLSRRPEGLAAFYAPDFHLRDPQPWWLPECLAKISKENLGELLSQTGAGSIVAPQWSDPSYTLFEKKFHSLKVRFQKGELNKAVPVVFATSKHNPSQDDLSSWISVALGHTADRTLYGLWDDSSGLLGVSPEWLFDLSADGRNLRTLGLAGTRMSTAESLLTDSKELHEHAVVVNDIRQRLQDYGSLEATKVREWTVGALTHLRTDIQVALREPQNFDWAIQTLHPTPALGISPRAESLAELEFLQVDVPRLRFGAPFGVNFGKSLSFAVVAIRNLQWSDQNLLLGSGCGIVPESQIEKEWQELNAKRESVKKIFGMRDKGF